MNRGAPFGVHVCVVVGCFHPKLRQPTGHCLALLAADAVHDPSLARRVGLDETRHVCQRRCRRCLLLTDLVEEVGAVHGRAEADTANDAQHGAHVSQHLVRRCGCDG